ncbi:MAG: DUF1684 domain-containing protein [Chloroflexota bacterium]
MDVNGLLALRKQKNNFYRTHPHSPLTPEQQQHFTGLTYYDPNPSLILEVEVDVFEDQEQILMQTNRNELKPFFRYGSFDVTVGEQTASLTIYRSPEGNFFLPFVDANAGSETYPAGRYLDLESMDDGLFVVDFNLAYNPYCAYNERWVCPVTPAENRIDLPIEAGEKLPAEAWVTK